MARASSSVSVSALPVPMRMPELVMLPERTMIMLLPMEAICCWMRACAPEPMATIAITAATPMMMPSMVSAERILLMRSAPNAICMLALSFFMTPAPPLGRRAASLQFLRRIARRANRLVAYDPAVLERDDALSVERNIGLMRHHHDADAFFAIQPLEDRHDLDAGARIERARGFVGQNDLRIVDQAPRNRHALLLAAGKLVGMMAGAILQSDDPQRVHGALMSLLAPSAL